MSIGAWDSTNQAVTTLANPVVVSMDTNVSGGVPFQVLLLSRRALYHHAPVQSKITILYFSRGLTLTLLVPSNGSAPHTQVLTAIVHGIKQTCPCFCE